MSFSGDDQKTDCSSDSSGIRTHNRLVRKRTLNHLVKLALNFRYGAYFEQGVPWRSVNYRV